MDMGSTSTREAGPSTIRSIPRKPKRPHPSSSSPAHSTSTQIPAKRRKLPPPLPPKSTISSHPSASTNGGAKHSSLPIKTLQGQGTRRTDASRPAYGREVIFVTRKVSLGTLMGRCKSLVVSEGYTGLTLYAMTAAIPHALLLLHALLDLLPYPKGQKGMWYEIRTGSTECVDEVQAFSSTGANARNQNITKVLNEEDSDGEFRGIGGIEEKEPEIKPRIQSTIRIDLHISSRPRPKADLKQTAPNPKITRNRPSKRVRESLRRQRKAEQQAEPGAIQSADEEEMMNTRIDRDRMVVDDDEEAVEEIEER